jgi:hypothetical protein
MAAVGHSAWGRVGDHRTLLDTAGLSHAELAGSPDNELLAPQPKSSSAPSPSGPMTGASRHRRVPGTAGWRPAALNTERAAELGTQIAEGKKTASTRPHPHTPPSPAALKTAGPIAPAPGLVNAGQRASARASWALFIDERPLMLRRRASE